MDKIPNRNWLIENKLCIFDKVHINLLKKGTNFTICAERLNCFYEWIKISRKLRRLGKYMNHSIQHKITIKFNLKKLSASCAVRPVYVYQEKNLQISACDRFSYP